MEIDEGKAMVAYWGSGFDMIMPFREFKSRYGHFYRKDGVERSCRTCKHRKRCDTDKIVSEGVIDEGYDGSVCVKLYNHGERNYQVKRGDKITQLVVIECLYPDIEIVDEIHGGERGNGGFGSTGR